jgi:hypothetical protein
VSERPAEAIKAPNQKHIKPSSSGVLHQPVKRGAGFLGPRDRVVDSVAVKPLRAA